MTAPANRGPIFNGKPIGKLGAGSLIAAGYTTLAAVLADLGDLLPFHGAGSKAVRRLVQTRAD